MFRTWNTSDELDMDMLSNISSKSSKSVTSPVLTNKNYTIENYNISICTDDLNYVYMKVINKITYQNYESNIKPSDLESGITIDKFVKIIIGCFEKKMNYQLEYELSANKITFYFTVKFDGFYEISQNITLSEKEFNQDKKISAKVIELQTRIEDLEAREIILGYDTSAHGNFIKIKKNIEEIDFRRWNDPKFQWYGNLWDFNEFSNLKKIIMDDNQFGYNYEPLKCITYPQYKLKDIPFTTDRGHFKFISSSSQDNMFNSYQIYLPNVKEVIFHSKGMSDFNTTRMASLPNLCKVVFEQYENKLLNTFEFIKQNGIKHVVYNNCLNIGNLDLIKNYFETNNFVLEIIKM
jgi:hypothetical protein